MNDHTILLMRQWAETYNNPVYFETDPIAFPRHFMAEYKAGRAGAKDVEVAALLAAHLAWGRRAMIVRDCTRLFDEMAWRPYDYVMRGSWRSDGTSLHRTVRWSEMAAIFGRIREHYLRMDTLENLSVEDFRCAIYGSKPDKSAPNKKINMMRRWLVRTDGKVDLGLWRNTDPAELLIPLDVHVHTVARQVGITGRKQTDIRTVGEITGFFREIFPDDPCLGDFALFGYGVTGHTEI